MANYVYIAESLDGFIATTDGGIDWLMESPNADGEWIDETTADGSDFGYADFTSGIDAIVMGRNSFDKVLTFDAWPYELPVFVLSNSLTSVPDISGAEIEITNGELKSVVSHLAERGYENLYIDGGRVIQSFLKEDLIDEMMITSIPILLGDGIPLFDKIGVVRKFRHVNTEVLGNSLVKSHFVRIRE